jgi:hypothetical protein
MGIFSTSNTENNMACLGLVVTHESLYHLTFQK